jgi:hypothetical protein
MDNKKCYRYWEESEFLPFDGILDLWCGEGNKECRTAKEHALFNAIRKNLVKCKTSSGDRINYEYDAEYHARWGLLLVERISFEKWAEGIDERIKEKLTIHPKTERTDLYLIGGLLEILLELQSEGLKNQDEICAKLVETKLKGMPGGGDTTIKMRFSLANKAINAI